jgi:hypothetical protein
MQLCHRAAYVAACLQAAPILIDTKEEIDGEEAITTGAFHEQLVGILSAGSFDGDKVDLGYFLENAPAPDDESEDAVWSMQRELAAAITEIQDGAQEILDKINEAKQTAGEEEIDMPPILDGEVYQFCDGLAGKGHIQAKIMSAVQDLEMELFTMQIMQLPADAQERMAFIHDGVFSRQWIYEFEDVMNGPELRGILSIHMGLPGPACSGSIGKRVINTNSYLDRYGRALHSEKA